MPFYGTFTETINGANGYNGLTWYDIKIVNDLSSDKEITWGPCANYLCEVGFNCFTGDPGSYDSPDIIKNSTVTISFRYCLTENNNAYFVSLESELRKISDNYYEIWGKRYGDNNYHIQGTVELFEKIPPVCQIAPLCDATYNNRIEYSIVSKGSSFYDLSKLCSRDKNAFGITVPIADGTKSSNIYELNAQDVSICIINNQS